MKIIFNERFFRDHQKEAAALKAKGGMVTQLPMIHDGQVSVLVLKLS